MLTEEQIVTCLEELMVLGAMRSLVKLNMVRRLAIFEEKIEIDLASATLNSAAQDLIAAKVCDVIGKLSGGKRTEIGFVKAKPKELNEIKHVIAVMSGKGGVGKSLVTSFMALSLVRRGYDVGILDADITGPSIPRMFGVTARPMGSDTGVLPVLSQTGIEIMSLNLLLPHEDDAVIWRGSTISSTIEQFWEEVLWGRLDYLLVDLPPGTSDAPLTVMESLPLSNVVIVFSPQELATMVVRKAVQMTQKMDVPILGVVENMSYFILPDTGERMELFGKSKGHEMSKATGAPLLGQIPIDPEIAGLCDEGNIEGYDSKVLQSFGETVIQAMRKDCPSPLKGEA